MGQYRLIKAAVQVPASFPPSEGEVEYIEFYEVQVRGVLWWHTIKTFKKIRPAFRLLTFLKNNDNEA